MPPPTNQSCGNCTYWNQGIPGVCNRYPPQAIQQEGIRQAAGGYHIERYDAVNYFFPDTQSTDWCGEWASK